MPCCGVIMVCERASGDRGSVDPTSTGFKRQHGEQANAHLLLIEPLRVSGSRAKAVLVPGPNRGPYLAACRVLP